MKKRKYAWVFIAWASLRGKRLGKAGESNWQFFKKCHGFDEPWDTNDGDHYGVLVCGMVDE
jgi:hypothetical protein